MCPQKIIILQNKENKKDVIKFRVLPETKEKFELYKKIKGTKLSDKLREALDDIFKDAGL